jgi:hypothetical protein
MMMASKQDLSQACIYGPLVCVNDRTDIRERDIPVELVI